MSGLCTTTVWRRQLPAPAASGDSVAAAARPACRPAVCRGGAAAAPRGARVASLAAAAAPPRPPGGAATLAARTRPSPAARRAAPRALGPRGPGPAAPRQGVAGHQVVRAERGPAGRAPPGPAPPSVSVSTWLSSLRPSSARPLRSARWPRRPSTRCGPWWTGWSSPRRSKRASAAGRLRRRRGLRRPGASGARPAASPGRSWACGAGAPASGLCASCSESSSVLLPSPRLPPLLPLAVDR